MKIRPNKKFAPPGEVLIDTMNAKINIRTPKMGQNLRPKISFFLKNSVNLGVVPTLDPSPGPKNENQAKQKICPPGEVLIDTMNAKLNIRTPKMGQNLRPKISFFFKKFGKFGCGTNFGPIPTAKNENQAKQKICPPREVLIDTMNAKINIRTPKMGQNLSPKISFFKKKSVNLGVVPTLDPSLG